MFDSTMSYNTARDPFVCTVHLGILFMYTAFSSMLNKYFGFSHDLMTEAMLVLL